MHSPFLLMDADMDMGGSEPIKIARPCLIRTSPYRSKYKIDMDGHKLSVKIISKLAIYIMI